MLEKKFYKLDIETDESKRQEFIEGQIWADHNGYRMGEFDEYYQIVEYVPTVAEQIADLKQQLSSTDYKCLKYVDGALSEEEYAEIKLLRANLRQQINELEAQAN